MSVKNQNPNSLAKSLALGDESIAGTPKGAAANEREQSTKGSSTGLPLSAITGASKPGDSNIFAQSGKGPTPKNAGGIAPKNMTNALTSVGQTGSMKRNFELVNAGANKSTSKTSADGRTHETSNVVRGGKADIAPRIDKDGVGVGASGVAGVQSHHKSETRTASGGKQTSETDARVGAWGEADANANLKDGLKAGASGGVGGAVKNVQDVSSGSAGVTNTVEASAGATGDASATVDKTGAQVKLGGNVGAEAEDRLKATVRTKSGKDVVGGEVVLGVGAGAKAQGEVNVGKDGKFGAKGGLGVGVKGTAGANAIVNPEAGVEKVGDYADTLMREGPNGVVREVSDDAQGLAEGAVSAVQQAPSNVVKTVGQLGDLSQEQGEGQGEKDKGEEQESEKKSA